MQLRFGKAILRADRPILREKLIGRGKNRLLLVVQMFWGRRWNVHRRAHRAIERTDGSPHFGTQQLSLDSKIGVRREFEVDGCAAQLVGRRSNRADDALGNNGTEGLVEARQLSGLQSKTLIEA